MASTSRHHHELTDGEGKCSVPMWCGGVPAGFCDAPAFGRQEKGQRRYVYENTMQARGEWVPRYCQGLACYAHGGPREREAPDA